MKLEENKVVPWILKTGLFFFCFAVCFIFLNRLPGDIYLNLDTDKSGTHEVVFDRGTGYSSLATFEIKKRDSAQTVRLQYPFNTRKLSFHLLNETGEVNIHSVVIKNFLYRYEFSGQALVDRFRLVQQVQLQSVESTVLLRSIYKKYARYLLVFVCW